MLRNGGRLNTGTGGRNRPESVAGMDRKTQFDHLLKLMIASYLLVIALNAEKEVTAMSKEDKIEQAAEKGSENRQSRIDNENLAGTVVRIIGPDIYYNPPSDPEEKEAYDDAYYNRK